MSTNPRQLTGVVISDKADKTITVKIERKVKHPTYSKIMKRSTKVHAHDEENMAKVGDVVTVQECRPYSKSKTWKLLSEGEAVLSEPEIQESQS
ncbi:30S ribosomal protein S17 [Gammaproteobacteria bacterium]|jgi:small subunit ribosomal protein S17|nr:30S ribosomal protein S17 [SAR86 cluster bacterium]MDA8708943.1 30S ribosomal protein S17 [Gammaproteobacteria bacterium]MBL6701701.1 30S ribosomal protein S17 [SAR86 cluster bacterium]MDA8799445.1 30S ribosomal protein S17 [Gammaproteobacteria bacterium]MDA9140942.1 30S ribosomal protein S17 [Gammaproteobacteria bacterium]|tara:strand:+ start:370 stop:651 length:282 start_codon:yes stop_codon:yes gene_type:complete